MEILSRSETKQCAFGGQALTPTASRGHQEVSQHPCAAAVLVRKPTCSQDCGRGSCALARHRRGRDHTQLSIYTCIAVASVTPDNECGCDLVSLGRPPLKGDTHLPRRAVRGALGLRTHCPLGTQEGHCPSPDIPSHSTSLLSTCSAWEARGWYRPSPS